MRANSLYVILLAISCILPSPACCEKTHNLIPHFHGVQNRQGGRVQEAKQREASGPSNGGGKGGGGGKQNQQSKGGGGSQVKKSEGPFCDDEYAMANLPFCINDDYEKHVRPQQEEATHVEVKLKITEIEKIDDANLTMTFHMDFDLAWKDPRVEVTNDTEVWNATDPMQEWITIDQELVDKYLWIPDIAVYNLKEFQMSWVLHPMATVNLFPNKLIHYVFAARVTVGCNFFFENFPLDKQECEFYVGSYGHTKEEIILNGSYVQLHRDRQRPLQYDIEVVDLEEAKKMYQSRNERGEVEEEFSVTGFKVKMVRGYAVYLTRTYFPSALMVIVSFISYLIGQEEVVGRLALLVTLTLIEINIMNQTDNYKVPARSTTALQLYVLVCLMFVCAGLFEYALVLYRDSPVERTRRDCMRRCRGKSPLPKEKDEEKDEKESGSRKDSDDDDEDGRRKSRKERRMNEEAKNQSDEHTPNEDRSDESQVQNKHSSKRQSGRREKGGRYYVRPSEQDKGKGKSSKGDKKKKDNEGRKSKRGKSDGPETIEDKLQKACDTKNIDIVSGMLFPCLFVIFNLVYWVYYLA